LTPVARFRSGPRAARAPRTALKAALFTCGMLAGATLAAADDGVIDNTVGFARRRE
jgi:hypothetical protein